MRAALNSAEEAVSVVERARGTFRIPASFAVAATEPRFVQLVEGAPVEEGSPPEPGRVRDALVWVVILAEGASAVECAVEVATLQIVRVRWSLGCAREEAAAEVVSRASSATGGSVALGGGSGA